MLWKKQRDTKQQRVVQPLPKPKVFSYYQSRSLSDEARIDVKKSRSGLTSPIKTGFKDKLIHAPMIIAAIVLAGCLVYLTTLDPNPRLQAALESQRAETMLGDLSEYQPAIKDLLSSSILSRSKLLVDTRKLEREIQKEFPELGQVSIVLPLVSRRPIVEVQPADPVLAIASAEGSFVVDHRGKALADTNQLSSTALARLPQVQDQSGLPLNKGSIVLPEATVEFIATVVAQLNHQKLVMQSIVLPSDSAGEVHVRLSDQPYTIKFNLKGESRPQIGTFLAVKDYLGQRGVKPAEYIDVRLPEKAFYR